MVEAIPLKKAIRVAISNFIHEHVITWFRIPRRLINDSGTPFVNKDVRSLVEAYHIKHKRSTPYYPQGNGQVEATNRVTLKIPKKMKHEYGGKWSSHLIDVLWASKSSLKTATEFSPFSLIYGPEVISLVELTVFTPKVELKDIQGDTDDTHAKGRLVDLEGIEEK